MTAFSLADDEETRNWLFVGLNQLGKVGVCIGISILYIWCSEIYPTIMRNTLVGITSMFARVGSISAPFIADLVRNYVYTMEVLYPHELWS